MCWCYAIIFALKEIYFGNINCKIFKGKSKYQEYVVDVKIWIFSSDLWHSLLNLIEFSNCSGRSENALPSVLLCGGLFRNCLRLTNSNLTQEMSFINLDIISYDIHLLKCSTEIISLSYIIDVQSSGLLQYFVFMYLKFKS